VATSVCRGERGQRGITATVGIPDLRSRRPVRSALEHNKLRVAIPLRRSVFLSARRRARSNSSSRHRRLFYLRATIGVHCLRY